MTGLRDVRQAWTAERMLVPGQAAMTRAACFLIGLGLLLAGSGYLALERERGLIPWVVSLFVEDGTWVLHLHPALRNPQIWPKVRQQYASPYYWPAVQVLAYLAWVAAGLAVWQALRLLRASWPRTWGAVVKFINSI